MVDLKDPDEVQLPSRDLILITLRVEYSCGHVPFPLLGDLLLDRGHGSAIGTLVSETLGGRIVDPTHVVNSLVASSTDWLSSSNRLPFNPRSSALHTPAQVFPSST